MKPKRIPSYRLHKATGNAVVTLSNHDYYLGKHDSPESHAEYDRVVMAWISRGRLPECSENVGKVSGLVKAFHVHAESYYVKNGYPTGRMAVIRIVGRELIERHGNESPDDIKPSDFLAMRRSWIGRGLARRTIGLYWQLAVQIFRWGVESELVSPATWHGLTSISGLSRGRDGVHEPATIKPATQAQIDGVLAVAKADICDMIRVQVLTGMRPSEIACLATEEIDRSEAVWIYRPSRHKTEHHDKTRVIAIGPRAQEILLPWIARSPSGYVFPPKPKRRLASRKESKLPPWADLAPSYGRSIKQACMDSGVEHWAPNQLRHAAATEIRKRFGVEHAGAVLGHSNVSTTELYAERNMEMVVKIAMEMG